MNHRDTMNTEKSECLHPLQAITIQGVKIGQPMPSLLCAHRVSLFFLVDSTA